MKYAIVGVAAMMLAGLVGCGGTPGGPGAMNEQPLLGVAEGAFSLTTPPLLSTSVKQGGSAEATIGIIRGVNFAEDVAISFGPLPTGVTIEPPTPALKRSDADAKIKIVAAPEAALGDFTVKVSGHPTKGPDAVSELKISVVKE